MHALISSSLKMCRWRPVRRAQICQWHDYLARCQRRRRKAPIKQGKCTWFYFESHWAKSEVKRLYWCGWQKSSIYPQMRHSTAKAIKPSHSAPQRSVDTHWDPISKSGQKRLLLLTTSCGSLSLQWITISWGHRLRSPSHGMLAISLPKWK